FSPRERETTSDRTAAGRTPRPRLPRPVLHEGPPLATRRRLGIHVVLRLFGEGWTIVIRSAEKHDAELARLAEGFRADFAAPVNVHVYCTPPERSGFSWHYDPEDVFIVQTHGAKEYQLRKNTVNPWPLLEQMPKDLKYEREVQPTWSCV